MCEIFAHYLLVGACYGGSEKVVAEEEGTRLLLKSP